MSDKVALKAKMEECQDFKKIQENRANLTQNFWFCKLLIFTIFATLVVIITQAMLSFNETRFKQNSWYAPTTFVTGKVVELLAVIWIVLGTNYVMGKSQK